MNSSIKHNISFWILIILVVLEGFLISLAYKYLPTLLTPWIYLLIGVSIGSVILTFKNTYFSQQVNDPLPHNNLKKTLWLLPLAIALFIFTYIQFKAVPIDYLKVKELGSDVIPQMHYFVKRFLAGTFPYDPIPINDLDYVLHPTYPPLKWMPYVLSEWLNIDYRIQGMGVYIISLLFFSYYIIKSGKNIFLSITIASIPFILSLMYFSQEISSITRTMEYDVAAYYLLVCISLFTKNRWAIAISILFCLLSRYSLVFWLPLVGITAWYYYGFKYFGMITLIISGGVLFIYGPFLWFDMDTFIRGYEYYALASINEWTPYENHKLSYHLEKGFGFASYAYLYLTGSIEDKINTLQNIHLYAIILTILILTAYWWKNKDQYSFDIFAIGSFKIYLTLFYSFVVIPYGYLNIVPLMVSFGGILIIYKVLQTPVFNT